MKTQFIQIQDISEIDTTRVNIYDLNKRYVDRTGNMFGLRYNRESKKVEIIKIMRTTARNESYFAQKMMSAKKVNQSETTDSEENASPETEPEEETVSKVYEEHRLSSDPELLKNEMFSAITTYKERVSGITKNLIYSRIVPREKREATIKFDDLIRDLDIDGAQRIDKIINSYREMTEYPRSINYYIGRLDTRGRNMVAGIMTDENKLKFLLIHEMYSNLKDLFLVLANKLEAMKIFVEEHKADNGNKINSQEKQALSDAILTIDNTITDIRHSEVKLINYEAHLFNPRNYS